jgi:hypothetical protein
MLSPIRSRRRFILASVKFLSREPELARTGLSSAHSVQVRLEQTALAPIKPLYEA